MTGAERGAELEVEEQGGHAGRDVVEDEPSAAVHGRGARSGAMQVHGTGEGGATQPSIRPGERRRSTCRSRPVNSSTRGSRAPAWAPARTPSASASCRATRVSSSMSRSSGACTSGSEARAASTAAARSRASPGGGGSSRCHSVAISLSSGSGVVIETPSGTGPDSAGWMCWSLLARSSRSAVCRGNAPSWDRSIPRACAGPGPGPRSSVDR